MGGIARARDDRQIGMSRAQLAHQALGDHWFVHGQDHRMGLIQPQPLQRMAAGRVAEGGVITRAQRAGDQIGVGIDGDVAFAMVAQHIGHQPPHAPETDDDGARFVAVRRIGQGGGVARIDLAG